MNIHLSKRKKKTGGKKETHLKRRAALFCLSLGNNELVAAYSLPAQASIVLFLLLQRCEIELLMIP